MKAGKLSAIFLAVALLVMPSVLMPVGASASDSNEKVEIRYTIFREDGAFEGVDSVSPSQADAVIKAIARINNDFRLLKAALTPEDVENAKAILTTDIACMSWLKIFAYLLDRIEDIIDAYITPWTKISVFSHIFSYGHGVACIPFQKSLPFGITRQTYVGMLLRPIWWKYNSFSYTLVRNEHLIPPRIDFWDMIGRQSGFMIGFIGIHISIIRPLMPDTHIFIGRTLILVNKDLIC
jgi:hypothetical protein